MCTVSTRTIVRKPRETKPKRDTYAVITDRIIAMLEQGVVPWRKPWVGGGEPKNLV